MIRQFVADRGDAGVRLDRAVGRHVRDLPQHSRTRVQALIAQGCVTLNGVPPGKASKRLLLGDRVAVALPDVPQRREHEPEEAPLTIAYEDPWLLAVVKPPGVVVHPTAGHRAGTLFNALLWHARTWGTGHRPGLVHRLDRDTSGLLLVAKDPLTHARLGRAMARRAIIKRYVALVYGAPTSVKGQIALALSARAEREGRVMVRRDGGRPAVTAYEELARSSGPMAGVSLLQCTLLTGRMHQLRAHLAAVGLPIVGDPLYGAPRWKGIADAELAARCRALTRQALHACELVLTHPQAETPLCIRAPLPADLRALVARTRWETGSGTFFGDRYIFADDSNDRSPEPGASSTG